MTISDPTASTITSASQLLNGPAGDNQAGSITDQAINTLSSLGESFSALFSTAQQASSQVQQQVTTPVQSQEDSVDMMQQSIFSSLGFGILGGENTQETLDLLTSQSSIENIQASLLSALQTSLFSAQAVTTSPQASTEGETVSEPAQQVSMLDSLSRFSFGDNGLDLNDGFDTFNILQHIPVVSAVYQDVSGQGISAVSKLSGGYFYGGPIGLAFSALDLAVEGFSGNSISETLVNFNYAEMFSGFSDTVFSGTSFSDNNEANNGENETDMSAESFPLAGQMASRLLSNR